VDKPAACAIPPACARLAALAKDNEADDVGSAYAHRE